MKDLPMHLLLRYLRTQERLFWQALAFAMINQVCLMLDPLFFRRIVDDYVMQFGRHSAGTFFTGAGFWLGAMLAAVAAAWIAKNLQVECVSRLGQTVGAAMFADGIRHSLELDYANFERSRSGETLDRLQKLRGNVERFLSGSVNIVFATLVGLVFVVAYASGIHWSVAPAFLVIAPLLAGASSHLSRSITRVQRQALEQSANLAGSATESLRNMELIRSLGLTGQQIAKLHQNSDRVLEFELEKTRRIRKLSFFHGAAVHGLRMLLVLLLLYLVFSRRISVGQFFSLYLYAAFLFTPLQDMGTVINQYREAEASLLEFQDLLDAPREMAPALPAEAGALETLTFDNVGFRYGSASRPALTGLSFHLMRGQTIAFVGPSGAGKTTLVKLVSGLYQPDSGRILYNAVAHDEVDMNGLRARTGLVTQDTQLFLGTIRDNLIFACPGASDEACLAALEQAAALPLLKRAGQGLDTLIGEGGIMLSGGEKQRLAIARALLRRADLLIFDEATSSLDSLTEREISDTMQRVAAAGKAMTILIAHRLSTISHADLIYVLDAGSVVQTGTHEELLLSEGLYRRLWLQQVGGRTPAAALQAAD